MNEVERTADVEDHPAQLRPVRVPGVEIRPFEETVTEPALVVSQDRVTGLGEAIVNRGAFHPVTFIGSM